MATSKISDNRVIHSQGREIIYNVWIFMSDEARDGIKNAIKSVGSKVMAATGIAKRTLARIIKEGKKLTKARQLHFQHQGNHVRKRRRSQS
jgi:hypothetical protein